MASVEIGRRRLAPSHLKSRANDVTFGLKIALACFVTWIGIRMVLMDGVLVNIGGTILLGLMFAHAVELQHQALHHLGFRSKRLNEVTGVLLGLPMLVSFAAYQASHLRHHAYLGTPKNREFFDYGDQYGTSRIRSLGTWAARFLMLAHYRQFAASVWRALRRADFEDETVRSSHRIRRDHLVMLAGIVLLAAVSVWRGDWLLLSVWLFPFCLVAAPVHAIIEMPEHYRCKTDSTDVFDNTRTIKSNAVMTWFTNGNNLHVEHHMMPNLPIERLMDLHEEIAPEIRNYHESYRDFFKSLMRSGR